MFVIGTAGHIDHGKSSIITSLTGINPDRLPEEQERGMTIDLGFAHYDTPDGMRIGIIDVPGHERFVRNMIAGAGGIDAVMLVVAADDGWMPQSQEHLQITKLLGIKYGLIVISKIDLADSGWIDLVEEDIREKVKGSFLEEAPIIRLSSVSKAGFDRLKEEINRLAAKVIVREDNDKPRLYIDRSFVLAGMGGVVAGTLRYGRLNLGQEVMIFPSRRRGRIRSIQSHKQQIDMALPGRRASISLTGIDKVYLHRGGVLTIPELLEDYPDGVVLALAVTVLPESPIDFKNRRNLLMILGTSEVEGEIRLFGADSISPGSQGIIFLKASDPILAFVGDRFVLRLPTPAVTVGGGLVLDVLGRFPRKKELGRFDYLRDRIALTPESLVTSELSKAVFVNGKKDFVRCNYSQTQIDAVMADLQAKSILGEYRGSFYRKDEIAPFTDKILTAMQGYLDAHPHIDGLTIDVVAGLTGESIRGLEPVLELMCEKGNVVKKKNRFDLAGRELSVTGKVQEASRMMEKRLLEGGFMPPSINELVGDDQILKEAFDYLLASGKVVKIGSGLAFHKKKWEEIVNTVRKMLDGGKSLTVAAFREKLDTTRKYAVPILEETDRQKITSRRGDFRIKGDNFERV
jgi:selenocysteine-specific elongation factor